MTLTVIKIVKRSKFPNLTNTIINRRSLNFGFSSSLYGFRIITPPLKEENELFTLPV